MKIFLCSYLVLNFQMTFAKESNPLLGKWRLESKDCKRPDFIFEKSKIIKIGDADGFETKTTFKKIKYNVSKGLILVDFSEQHGFGGSKSSTQLTFKVINPNSIVIEKKGLNEMFRCI